MARAQGARAQMALAFETVYGTPPASGFTRVPFASTSLGAEQPLISSELLGYGRDPTAPIKDAVTADGDVVVPIDAEAFGFWLTAAFGEPITSGTGPWTHEFRSGSWTLPSLSIETAMPEVPRFAMFSGCVLDQLSWQMQRSGLLTGTAKLVAQGETVATTTAAGTPAQPALKRFGHFNGSITRNGTALGNVVSAEITYANNLDRIETIRSDGRIDGADPSIAALTGRVEVRFADQVLVNQAIAGDPCEFEFGYALPSGESFTFTVHAVYLPRPQIEISGPQGVQVTFDWQAARDAGVGRMCTATDLGCGRPAFFSDAVFELAHDADPTRRAVFDLAAIAAGATRAFALPDVSTELAGLSGAQTFDGDKTFSGELEATGPVATIGTASGTATYGLGTGATASGATKTVNIGAGGAAGSDTVVNIGSATPGADGATVVNTPTVTFANVVTVVGMPQANLTALLLGLGGAVADAWNRLSVNTPAVLLNNAGAGIEATVNKAAAGNDAAFAFKTGFSARALIGLLGSDDFSFKVSPDGSAYNDAILIDRNSGRVELPKPAILTATSRAPAAPASGKLALYARTRAGQHWLEAMRPTGREFAVQPHLGLARPATWLPSSGATVTTEGMSNSTVGTVSTPGLAATSLATSMRRWRLTSAATGDSAADQRSGVFACWRGNAAGLGGWTFVTRLSLATLQVTGMAFFGLYGSTAALATTLALSAVVSCIGIGFQRGTHTRWQLVNNDASGAPTLTDMGASFAIATSGVLMLLIAASPNAGSIWVRVVDEVSGAVFEQEVTADLPAANQFLAPRLFMNNGATAAAVAFDCSGVYVETDF